MFEVIIFVGIYAAVAILVKGTMVLCNSTEWQKSSVSKTHPYSLTKHKVSRV